MSAATVTPFAMGDADRFIELTALLAVIVGVVFVVAGLLVGVSTVVGLVSLPGMMTGQILGGSVPLVAIKYQIVIMLGICA